ncbi:cation-translocating P-type ATPase [Thermopolyspora sp. NPDC052614]|uniref:cation-translocating P-type ATPase n=1 Tax=Thermopolyspora sp. NPDC052614 TaxID=3155682 RepID=UPI00341A52B7
MGLIRIPNVGDVLSAAIHLTVAGTAALAGVPSGVAGAARRVPRTVRECFGYTRRVWRYEGRVHIGLRSAATMTPERAEAIESALSAHPRVEWACVNAPLGRVIASVRDPAPDPAELIEILEKADAPAQDDTAAEPRPPVPPQLMLAADALGLAVTALERVVGRAPLPAEVAAAVSLAETAPPLRRVVAAAVPEHLLPLLTAAAQALVPGGAGLAADVPGRLVQWRERRAVQAAWRRREPELCGTPERARAVAGRREVRVRPLPKGPLERHADQALTAAAGGTAAGLLSGSLRRGFQVGLAAVPKAASWAREGFAAELATRLARHGAVVTDPARLRLLDRVDLVIADTEVVLSAEPSIGEVVPTPDADPERVAERVYALFDASAYRAWTHGPAAQRANGRGAPAGPAGHRDGDAAPEEPGNPPVLRDGDGWSLGPIDRLTLRGRTGKRERRRIDESAAVLVLGLAEGERLRAVVSVVRRPEERAHALVTAARRAGLRFVLAGDRVDLPGDPVETVPGGERLAASVREAQDAGATVLLISRDGAALGAADIGVGVGAADRPPPWGAHVIGGHDPLATAVAIVTAAAYARRAGERGVTLARAGSGVGALLALTGPSHRAAGHAQAAVSGVAVLALAYGVWQARQAMRVPPAPPPSTTPWHAMPVPAVLRELGTTERGLSEAAARRRARPETILTPDRPGLPRAVAAELANPLTPVLAVGAIGSAVVGSLADALLISLVIGSSSLVGGAQRVATDRTVAEMAVRSTPVALVRRDGRERHIEATGLVRGDVIVLRSGDVVPADCRIVAAEGLEADESSLTGESLPVAKTERPVLARQVADRRSMLYEGTVVAAGEAVAVVVAVGAATETGRALAAAAGTAPETGVEARLATITRATTPVALGAALVSALSGVVRGHPLRRNLGAAISLAVAAVPEGLPLLVSAAQLAATRRLAARGVHARHPRTIEALGRVNVLCFDKTGTLTEGGIRLTHVADARHGRPLSGLDDRLRRVLEIALRATPEADDENGHRHLTDAAVAEGAASAGVGRGEWERLVEIPFEPSRGFHACLGREGRRTVVCVKGAPEIVLPRCRTAGSGRKGGVDIAAVEAAVERLASTGHRVLAVAEGTAPDAVEDTAAVERLAEGAAGDLTFVGLLGLADVVRDAAAPAIARLNDAGVQIVMLTGDHPSTAGAIAAHVTGRDAGHRILTGTEIDELPDEELDRVLPTADVVARCTPAHKVRVVQSFQRTGRVVAMTGDGANDAAGIRLADVGIALGGGTRAAQAAADLVVADDRLETIISALVEGRAMWASVREALAILVGGNLGEIAFTLFGALAGGRAPLSARQLLLVNLLTDLAPALAIAVRAPSKEAAATLLGEGPETSLGSALTRDITARAAVTTVGAGLAWIAARLTGPDARARTIGLVALVGTQLAQTLAAGGGDRPVLLSALGSAAVLAAVVQIPPLSFFFGCVPLDPLGWATALAAIAAAMLGSRLLPRLIDGRPAGPS